MQVITTKSVAVGVATGALVAVAVGQLIGAPWMLAGLNGLAAGALALASYIVVGDGRFGVMNVRRRPGLRSFVYAVMFLPAFMAGNVMEVELARAEGLALALLFLFTGFAAHAFGGILSTLEHLEDADG